MVRAGRQLADAGPGGRLAALDDLVGERSRCRRGRAGRTVPQTLRADLARRHLGVQVAGHVIGLADVGEDELPHVVVALAGLHQLADRDPQAFLEARRGRRRRCRSRRRRCGGSSSRRSAITRPLRHTGTSTVTSSSCPAVLYGSLVINTSPGSSESIGYSSRMLAAPIASELMWPGVPVTAWATMRPRRSNTALARSPASRTIGLNAARCSARGLLVDRGDQALPQHLELDSDRTDSSAYRSDSSLRSNDAVRRATSTCQPGRMTIVVSRSSTIAGPSNASPAPSDPRL